MEIDPRKNGVHSLAEGLRAFKKFHDNPEDVFALKDSILRSHHALETLFKHILYQINPILLVSEKLEAKEIVKGYERFFQGNISTVLDEVWTVNLKETIERLQKFRLLKGLEEREYELFLDSVEKLTNYRNKLQHLGLSTDPDEVGRILGNGIPRAIDVLEATYSHLNELMLSSAKFGFLLYGASSLQTSSIVGDLKEIFPDAPSVISLLRHDYDQLIREAIEFFKGQTFYDQKLKLKIVDYGRVGAPPYVPDLLSEGFLNFKCDRLSPTGFEPLSRMRGGAEEEEVPYMAEVHIRQPAFTRDPTNQNFGVAEGSLELEARVMFERADAILNLPDAEEKIAALRRLTAEIKVVIDYQVHALMTDWHYDCVKILKTNGQLSIRLRAVPKGYGIKSEDAELIGQYQSNLNKANAPFRLHAFLEPDGSLKKNYSLEWSIDTKGDIRFT